ncbi:hypothetical protein HGRIS_011758 [Hohenbuehelia grisea]|uniref:RNA helicase n=1 Tax=Hohenbuehelia grisea TaxID=104357 RepID=A0ABR3JYC0_9AGAR
MSSIDHKLGRPLRKRKSRHNLSGPRKKSKTEHSSLDSLPWHQVVRPKEAGLGDDDGILELEEVEGVEIVYEETDGGRVAKFNVIDVDEEPELSTEPTDPVDNGEDIESEFKHEEVTFDSASLLPDWHPFTLHPKILRVLHNKSFTKPTPIQAASVPAALSGRDVVGVAETGSGKTLAYGLPILNRLFNEARPHKNTRRPVKALILAPTRELALQVSSHLNDFLNAKEALEQAPAKKSKGKSAKKDAPTAAGAETPQVKRPPLVSVAAIVGGMSAQKQRRVLDRGVDVLVATPGRLWDIMQDDDTLSYDIRHLQFLVLDEADRMIETGHFAELDNILRLTLRENSDDQIPTEFDQSFGDELNEEDNKADVGMNMQTFVFSATLSKDLQRNLKIRKRRGDSGKYKKKAAPPSTLDDLVLRLDFRDPEPKVIDISPEGGVVSTLKESQIECLSADKDVYLYYFFLRYPGRSLVFLSAIDGIRRLMPLLELLDVKAFPLHSQLEQRQRLKNLDRFKTTPNSVLLATDIAARGLDIPAVDHVIHYQIPRTADAYVHRNGRTARAMRKGFSMLLCAPDERRVVKALLSSLARDEGEIPEMPVELNIVDKLKARIQLARRIETAHHKVKKQNHERNWMKETAEAMELELDSDFMSDSDGELKPSKQIRKAQAAKNAALKTELKQLLAEPLVVRGFSTRYITSGSNPIVDDLLAGESNEAILGLKKADAGNDLVPRKQKKTKAVVKEDSDAEEWAGFSADS